MSRTPELVRTLHVKPYIPGLPWFRVEIYDPNEWDSRGAPVVWWRLYKHQKGHKPVLVFDGLEEPHKWRCAGWFSVDGDEAAECVLNSASIRPSDTDREFFDGYSPEQLAFAEEYGESIGMVNWDRFHKGEN